jgi:hypothetical protein
VVTRLYQECCDEFDKVLYAGPAIWINASPEKRLQNIRDDIYGLCHYRKEKKLVIINQVELFGGDDVLKSELKLLLTNLCTIEGQILIGC